MRWAFWALAAVYFVSFLAWFHSVTLFGTGETPEGRQRRYYLLGTALTPSPESALVDLVKRLGKTEYLFQRTPLIGAAAAIWTVAVLLGDSLLCLALGRTRLGGWTRFAFAFGLGMGALSLVTLGLGLAGRLTPYSATVVAGAVAVCWIVLRLAVRARRIETSDPPSESSLGWKSKSLMLVVMGAFAVLSLMSACLPTTDYDALGYHLLAPREWWEAGRIFFLPHNVYASFPFLTEMFHLLGMTVIRDWFAGGLVGQVSLWAFGPMGALAVGLLASRWFGSAAGWGAALVYLSTPWVFRLSAIPYVEAAMMFFGTLGVLSLGGMPKRQRGHVEGQQDMPALTLGHATPNFFLAGACVGCAAACKYTSLLMLGVPIGLAVLWQAWTMRSWRIQKPTAPVDFISPLAPWGRGVGGEGFSHSTIEPPLSTPHPAAARPPSPSRGEGLRPSPHYGLLAFASGVLLFFGPWLVRNAVWTGNPVYPLAYSVFGGTNWTPEKAAKFAAGHRSTDFSPASAGRYLVEIPVHSDWQSGLVFALAPIPLALCLFRQTSATAACSKVWTLSALIVWQFLAFYFFTHRLDRFWLPLLPYACVLAGAGWSAFAPAFRAWIVTPLACVVILYNFAYCTTRHTALNNYTGELMEHRRFSRGTASRAVQLADESGKIPPGARVLYVGFAGVYYSDHPFRYNSVFDDSLFELLVADPASPNGVASLPELRRRFRERGIHSIVVDWEWIRKYKSPGNYGYSDFVTPERFKALMETSFLWRNFSETLDLPDEQKSSEPKLEIYRVQYELEP